MPEIFGKNVKPQTLWIGGGATVVFAVGYYRYSKKQKADQAAAAAATAPGTGAGSSDQIDPATGFPYGSQEDAAALSAQGAYQNPYAGYGGGYGGGGAYPSGTGGTVGFTNNAQWSQAAETFLVDSEGENANAVGNALGKYITGGAVDDAGQNYVNQAIAFEGYPPVAGPDGFPPSIRNAPPAPGGGGTGSGGGGGGGTGGGGHRPPQNVTVPNVIGFTSRDAFAALRRDALNPEPGGIKATRIVESTNPPAGKSVPKHTTVHVKVK